MSTLAKHYQPQSSIHKSATLGERAFTRLLPNRVTGWPGGWGQNRIEQVNHYTQWTYIAIKAIMRKIGQLLPDLAYVRDHAMPGRTEKHHKSSFGRYGGSTHIDGHVTRGALYNKALSVIKPHEELEPLENDHPLRRLFEQPNPRDTSFCWLSELDLMLELTGVGYLWAVPNQWGVPCELWVLPSHWVWPRTGYDKTRSNMRHAHYDELIQYYEVRPWGGLGSAGILKFPPTEVIPFSWKSPINPLDGWSALTAGAAWIDSEESITRSRWAQFINGARSELHIALGEKYVNPDQDLIERIRVQFRDQYQGEWNYGKPIITPPGATVTPISITPAEMAYFQSEEQIRDMILSLFDVPKTIVGISQDMTYGGNLASLATFCSNCLNPRLRMIGLVLTKFLAPKFERSYRGEKDKIRIWWNDCAPPNPEQVEAEIKTRWETLAISPNEVRRIYNVEPWPNGGDDPMTSGPGGMVPIPFHSGDDLEGLMEVNPFAGEQVDQQRQQTEQRQQPGFGEEMPPTPGQKPPGQKNPEKPGGPPAELKDRRLQAIEKSLRRIEKSLARKAACKPGERADLTHCTPINRLNSSVPNRTGSRANANGKQSSTQTASNEAGSPNAILSETTKPAGLKQAAKQVMQRIGLKVWESLPTSMQHSLAWVYDKGQQLHHSAQKYYEAGQQLARAVALEQGLSEKHANAVGNCLAWVDYAAKWGPNIPMAHGAGESALHTAVAAAGQAAVHSLEAIGGPVSAGIALGAKAAFYVPVASLMYVGVSAAASAGLELTGVTKHRDPFALIRKARQRVKTMSGNVLSKASTTISKEALAKALFILCQEHGPDEVQALFAAGLDQYQGDAKKSLHCVKQLLAERGPANKLSLNGAK